MNWMGDEPWHGTNTGYVNRKCRCDACKAARSEHVKAKRVESVQKLQQRSDRDGRGQTLQHGKEWLYNQGKCRCEACRMAASTARKERAARQLEREQKEAIKRMDEQWGEF